MYDIPHRCMMPLIDSFFSAGTHIFVSSHTFAAGVPSGENVSASADPLTVFFAGVPSGANVSAAGVPSSGGTCRRSVQRRHWGDWFLREGGFSHPDQVDAAGMSPVHHAIDQSIWSLRGEYAARDFWTTPLDTLTSSSWRKVLTRTICVLTCLVLLAHRLDPIDEKRILDEHAYPI